ncbi:helix-hairpin-helix domain-containing protein [Vogesella sp. LIG4]|uniref:helix-hairpin-helix domain-containing protein n=1 Tax=Vogesella sp. LIG4 TaxID=1192162 RepID=UPI00081FF0BE|nr:helix-hairpin-helix domain-containing protein [Vogesella sp. LIG4]SCK21395.1 Pathogenicity locus [Vogesella sp. LIG4]
MHPAKVVRHRVACLTDLPNIGPAGAADLRLLGINKPEDLIGQDALALFERLCAITASKHDPCVLDVLMSVVDFMAGGEPKPWWQYTAQRKRLLSESR